MVGTSGSENFGYLIIIICIYIYYVYTCKYIYLYIYYIYEYIGTYIAGVQNPGPGHKYMAGQDN
jgi:hypothetical protein